MNGSEHKRFMEAALQQAAEAAVRQEVPVGALLVDESGQVLAQGFNETVTACDPTAHAEIVVLRRAASVLGNYRLLSTTLYVTVEPCVMCMGALIHARVSRIVYGAPDPRWGAAGSLYDFAGDVRLNHHPEIVSGVCLEKCRSLMQTFFRSKR